ncbi:hypothetical protein DFH06DRAFT_1158956 [Mycena polygramma]|nr:hypothetical protein DFH06DRAFT_1158956 [Mycena polygramma]
MPFWDFEDVVENIVDEFFLDKLRDDGAYDYERLPENFVKLALVSRKFLNPVRRNLYRDLRIEGTERFLLLTGQLRFSPHLAKFVKSASLVSNCLQSTTIDGGFSDDSPGWESWAVSVTALRWFLDACPQLNTLDVSGGDFLLSLAAQDSKAIKLTEVTLMGCSRCNPQDPDSCMADLGRGWLKNIVTFPQLKELDISEINIGGPSDATLGVKSGSSVCTGLSISNMNRTTTPSALKNLLRSMPALKELVLDGLRPMPKGELQQCLKVVAGTLTLLTITDYHSTEESPQPWENDTVAVLRQLRTLSLNGVPVTPPFLEALPPRLEHLRLSRQALSSLPVPVWAAWLRREKFPLRGVLKKLQLLGELKGDTRKGGLKASDAQLAELAQLCGPLGIEWSYTRDEYEGFF